LPLYSVSHLGRATITGIAPFTLVDMTTMQIPFALLGFFGPISAVFPAVHAILTECTVTFNRRKMYLHLAPASLSLAYGKSLDLRHIVAPVKIGAV
jgi:hypothetical protein